MRKTILSAIFFCCSYFLNAQCQPDAQALFVLYYQVHFDIIDPVTGLPLIEDNSMVGVLQFPANSMVYFYNNQNDLVDSIMTDATGGGWIPVLATDFSTPSPGTQAGIAVSGSCSKPLSSIALLPVKLKGFSVNMINDNLQLIWLVEGESPGTKYEVQESNDGIHFIMVNRMNGSTAAANEKHYQYILPAPATQKFYRIKIIEPGNLIKYSAVKTGFPKIASVEVYPAVSNNEFRVVVPPTFLKGEYRIYNTQGMTVQKGGVNNTSFTIPASFGKGVFFIRMLSLNGAASTATVIIP